MLPWPDSSFKSAGDAHGLFNNFGQLKLNYSITSGPSLDTWRQPWKTGNKVKVPPDYSIQVNKDSIEIRGEDAQCLQFVALIEQH